jgi:hypothetical protein
LTNPEPTVSFASSLDEPDSRVAIETPLKYTRRARDRYDKGKPVERINKRKHTAVTQFPIVQTDNSGHCESGDIPLTETNESVEGTTSAEFE